MPTFRTRDLPRFNSNFACIVASIEVAVSLSPRAHGIRVSESFRVGHDLVTLEMLDGCEAFSDTVPNASCLIGMGVRVDVARHPVPVIGTASKLDGEMPRSRYIGDLPRYWIPDGPGVVDVGSDTIEVAIVLLGDLNTGDLHKGFVVNRDSTVPVSVNQKFRATPHNV
jgi:hypothetical protein